MGSWGGPRIGPPAHHDSRKLSSAKPLRHPLTRSMEHNRRELAVDSSRQRQLSVTAARGTWLPDTSPRCEAVLPAIKEGCGAANTANSEKRWQAVQRLSFENTTLPQPAVALG